MDGRHGLVVAPTFAKHRLVVGQLIFSPSTKVELEGSQGQARLNVEPLAPDVASRPSFVPWETSHGRGRLWCSGWTAVRKTNPLNLAANPFHKGLDIGGNKRSLFGFIAWRAAIVFLIREPRRRHQLALLRDCSLVALAEHRHKTINLRSAAGCSVKWLSNRSCSTDKCPSSLGCSPHKPKNNNPRSGKEQTAIRSEPFDDIQNPANAFRRLLLRPEEGRSRKRFPTRASTLRRRQSASSAMRCSSDKVTVLCPLLILLKNREPLAPVAMRRVNRTQEKSSGQFRRRSINTFPPTARMAVFLLLSI